jgi:hypothetical protein
LERLFTRHAEAYRFFARGITRGREASGTSASTHGALPGVHDKLTPARRAIHGALLGRSG